MVERKQFNRVRLLSVPINPVKYEVEVYTVNFPEKLRDLIISRKKDAAYDDRKEPDKNLKTILYHNISDIIYIDSISYNMDCSKWICSEEPIDLGLVGTFLKSWYSITYGEKENIDECVKELECEKATIIIDFESKGTNETIKPSTEAFTIFLSVIGKRISRELKLSIGSRECEFFMVTPIYNNSIELIANPSKFIDPRNKKSLWTYKVTLRIETTYKHEKAMLYINPSMIRICYDEINLRYRNKKTNTYIFIDRDKYSGTGNPHYIATDLIKNGPTLKWNKSFEELLKGIRLHKLLPSAPEIQILPIKFALNDEGFPVIVGFGSHLKGTHEVKSGLAMTDRYIIETEIAKLVKEQFKIFSDEILVVDRIELPDKETNDIIYNLEDTDFDEELLTELSKLSEVFQNKELISKEATIKLEHSRKYFKGKITVPSKRFIEKFPETLKINIFYKDIEWLELTRATLIFNLLLCSKSGNRYYSLNFPEKTIIINPIDVSEWSFTEDAETPEKVITSIGDFVDERETIELGLFELEDDQYYWNRLDPKLYIRQGLGRLNILTQFITPLRKQKQETDLAEVAVSNEITEIEELIAMTEAAEVINAQRKDKDRFKKAALDALRQYGLYRNTVDNMINRDRDTAYVGLYVYKSFSKDSKPINIPIMVSVSNEDNIMLSFNGGRWYDYREGLTKLASLKIEKEIINTSKIYDPLVLLKEKYDIDHIVLFADAFKVRSILQGFQNGKMNSDIKLIVGKEYGNIELEDRYKDVNDIISFVRIREESSNEVTDWCAFDGEDRPTSLPGGLFKLDKYNYYSIATKPGTAAKNNNDLKETRPGRMFRKETAVELCIPKVKDGINSEEIAIMADKLRDKVVLQFDEFTSYPFPLHLAELAVEYLE